MPRARERLPDPSGFKPSGRASAFAKSEEVRVREALGGVFEIEKCLGKGGMGMVFQARLLTSGCELAVKVLLPEFQNDLRAVRYFRREVRYLKTLRHPNILPVLKAGKTGAISWFAMPLVRPGNLREVLGGRAMSAARALVIAHQVASGLEFAHRQGIIHRDIKPSNVLIDGVDHVFLADFGLSRALDDHRFTRAQSERLEGTPQYQAPNVLRGEPGDSREDVYSFGALLYEILTGRPPFKSKTRLGVLGEMEQGGPIPILAANPCAAPDLALIAEAAMSAELEERYAAMSYVVKDLSRLARQQPPVGPHHRFLPS